MKRKLSCVRRLSRRGGVAGDVDIRIRISILWATAHTGHDPHSVTDPQMSSPSYLPEGEPVRTRTRDRMPPELRGDGAERPSAFFHFLRSASACALIGALAVGSFAGSGHDAFFHQIVGAVLGALAFATAEVIARAK